MDTITIYTDGGARGNPGPAGAGAVVFDEKGNVIAEVSEYLGKQTNNWAEYEAIRLGLNAAKKTFGAAKLKAMQIDVRLDSELATKQLNGQYQIKEPTLYPQFIAVHNLRVQFPNMTFTHVRRQNNTHADRLANDAMSSAADARPDGDRGQ